jgi:enoyl-CoA hydratase/carnithine racemase
MTAAVVLVEKRGPVGLITLNRPERRNAIDLQLRADLVDAIDGCMADDEVRSLVLAGSGPAFCAGGDIRGMNREGADRTVLRARTAARVVNSLWEGTKPCVAAVEGSAFGAGVSLALACDRVVVGTDATVSVSFTRLGLAGDMGIFATLPGRVGPARARQMLMLPEPMSGARAVEIGLFDVAVDPGRALTRALDDANALAAGPRLALREIRDLLGRWPTGRQTMLNDEILAQSRLFDTDDFEEGVDAFRTHRAPDFS